MTTIKYIGRTNDFKGKTLWEIVGNLKNHGVGRYVIRQMFQRYPEPSYMKIVKVEAMPNPTEVGLDQMFPQSKLIQFIATYSFQGDRKVKVFVEKTFRGRTLPKLVGIHSTSYKTDYQLIPKNKEAEMCRPCEQPEFKILPQTIEFPPLLREFIIKETGQHNPQLKVKIQRGREKVVRIAKDGETPNIDLSMGLGTPASPNLYKNLEL